MTDVADQKISMPLGLRIKLSAMMFLQFMTLPVWFNTIIPYVKTLPGGESWTVWCGMFIGFGTLASPLIGMFADRFLNAEKVLALTHLVYAALLSACFFVRTPAVLFTLLLLACFVNMPGWSLTATIAMTHSTPAAFPHIRVFGTLGWVASAVFSVVGISCLGITGFDTSPWIFACAAGTHRVRHVAVDLRLRGGHGPRHRRPRAPPAAHAAQGARHADERGGRLRPQGLHPLQGPALPRLRSAARGLHDPLPVVHELQRALPQGIGLHLPHSHAEPRAGRRARLHGGSATPASTAA